MCYLPPPPATTNGVNGVNDDNNGAVDDGGWWRRSARISALLCHESARLWRASLSYHKYAMNDGYYDEDAAWEPA